MTRIARAGDGTRLRETSIELEVPFHDVDALQIVWHGHYYKYFEQARTKLMRACKLDGPEVFEIGHGLLVIESRCRYVSPLRYGDTLLVHAWLADTTNRIQFQFEIENRTEGRIAARGHTTLVATTTQGDLLHRTPQAILDRLTA